METIDGRYAQALCFAAVAETSSFTRAAELLSCSKAHVSKQVSALEQALGVQLLLRTTRRLALTEAGRVYLDYCRQLRDTLQEGERAVAALQQTVAGTLRISAPTSMGEPLILDLLLALQARHPQLVIELDLSVQHRDLLGEGFDFALRTTHTLDDRLVARGLGAIDNLIVASPTFLARHPPIRTPGDLAKIPCLLNPHLTDEPDWLFQHEGQARLVRVDGRFRANHFGVLLGAALRGAGIARLPRFLVAAALADGRLQQLLIDHPCPPTPLYLVYPQRRPMPHRHQVFRDFVLDWFAAPARAAWLASR